MSQDLSKGASDNEVLIAAARTDNEELIAEVFERGQYDINCTDPFETLPYTTRTHLFFYFFPLILSSSVAHGSTDVLELILSDDNCDVDPINHLDKATPLHLAAKIEHAALRFHICESLLDAGADISIKDKHGVLAVDYVPAEDTKLRDLFRKSQAQANIGLDDVANDDDDDDGPGSGSDE
ncbi:hypothetical protein CVT24_011696 [Panaeolus cyanescens]|uniref:Uncharacterized protein n=1 Tax=Panaeolus cyanescens TaxID=181874 RepID=A0A409YH88_9AGAR|nr:hypothetical protein CVT24_011696 [Panaeolus cyanescens]